MSTGLSIKTLAEALAEAVADGYEYAGEYRRYYPRQAARADRLYHKLLAALCAKSERYEALERAVENGDRLMRAADIVLANLAHPEGASWPFLCDLLRSRMYTYTEARDGIEAAQRYGRTALTALAALDDKQ